MKFSDNLKALRQSSNYTQKFLAEKLNTTTKTISHWETGYTEPSIEQLILLADLFEITLDELVDRDVSRLFLTMLKK